MTTVRACLTLEISSPELTGANECLRERVCVCVCDIRAVMHIFIIIKYVPLHVKRKIMQKKKRERSLV